jgi:hypothetical protein
MISHAGRSDQRDGVVVKSWRKRIMWLATNEVRKSSKSTVQYSRSKQGFTKQLLVIR